ATTFCFLSLFLLLLRLPPRPTLFPYTTLFRSLRAVIDPVIHELRRRCPRSHLESRRACPAQRCVSDDAIRIETPLCEKPLHGARDVRDVCRDPIQRRQVLLANRRLVEERSQEAHEISL